MKLPSTLYSVRKQQNITKVPFQELLPLKLKNQVSGKQNRGEKVACIEEMAIMFACLKTNEFNESLCPKEITNFQKCCTENKAQVKQLKQQEMKGVITPGARQMGYKQINQVLRDFPQSAPKLDR